MTMRKILLSLSFIALTASPCLAAERVCPGARYLLGFNAVYSAENNSAIPKLGSYKATGKIEFLKPCADGKDLCKTGAYIDAGDYFIALPQTDNYYCAAYIPGGFQQPKAEGLIKGGNFIETPADGYNVLKGKWKNNPNAWDGNAAKTISFYMHKGDKFISMTGTASPPHEDSDDDDSYAINKITQTVILKIGPNFFTSIGDSIVDMALDSGKLSIDDYWRPPQSQFNASGSMSDTYTYFGPASIKDNIFK